MNYFSRISTIILCMILLFLLSLDSHSFSFHYENDGKESLSRGDSLIQEINLHPAHLHYLPLLLPAAFL